MIGIMEHADEVQAMRGVEERLVAAFPALPASEVQEAVASAHESMTGPIRDFVPVLAERAARARLSQLDAEDSEAAVQEERKALSDVPESLDRDAVAPPGS